MPKLCIHQAGSGNCESRTDIKLVWCVTKLTTGVITFLQLFFAVIFNENPACAYKQVYRQEARAPLQVPSWPPKHFTASIFPALSLTLPYQRRCSRPIFLAGVMKFLRWLIVHLYEYGVTTAATKSASAVLWQWQELLCHITYISKESDEIATEAA